MFSAEETETHINIWMITEKVKGLDGRQKPIHIYIHRKKNEQNMYRRHHQYKLIFSSDWLADDNSQNKMNYANISKTYLFRSHRYRHGH